MADAEIFGEIDFEPSILLQRFREAAYLTKGIWLAFIDERTDTEVTFYFEGGIQSFVRHLNKDREALFPRPIYIEKQTTDTNVECAIQYNTTFNEACFSFANCINTIDGGSHMTGFRTALTRVLNDYARKNKLLKDDDANLTGDDVREGLVAVISVKLAGAAVRGPDQDAPRQPRGQGRSPRPPSPKASRSTSKSTPRTRRRIIEKCIICRPRPRGRTQGARPGHPQGPAGRHPAARQARRLLRPRPGELRDVHRRGSVGRRLGQGRPRPSLPGHPAASGQDPQRREGPAGPHLRPRRDRGHDQGASAPASTTTCDMAKLRYHRVIIMTDADVDGAHIRTLLLTFFFRHMRPLIDEGHLYIAQPPLFKLTVGRTASATSTPTRSATR